MLEKRTKCSKNMLEKRTKADICLLQRTDFADFCPLQGAVSNMQILHNTWQIGFTQCTE